jgi:hypothetical protein
VLSRYSDDKKQLTTAPVPPIVHGSDNTNSERLISTSSVGIPVGDG